MAGTYISGISVDDVRLIGNVSSTDVANSTVIEFMRLAAGQLNHDIGIKVSDWQVGEVSNEKKNTIDGSNTTFYVSDWPLGDLSDDGEITGDDVIAYSIDSDGVRTTYTVSSIDDARIGKFTLSTAPPSSDTLYFTWRWVPLDQSTPDPLIKTAILYLTNAYIATRISPEDVHGWRMGKIAVTRQDSAYKKYMANYMRVVTQINSNVLRRRDHPGFTVQSGFSYV